jgi:hypothetical protein
VPEDDVCLAPRQRRETDIPSTVALGHEPTYAQVRGIRSGPITARHVEFSQFKPLEAWGAFRQYIGKYR